MDEHPHEEILDSLTLGRIEADSREETWFEMLVEQMASLPQLGEIFFAEIGRRFGEPDSEPYNN